MFSLYALRIGPGHFQKLCLGCHGKSIAPEVKAKLAELYPEDKATGFSEGDLRGAFVVTRDVPVN